MAICTNCGCSDHDPCVDEETGERCAWVELSEDLFSGVCSFCRPEDVDQEDEPLLVPSRQLILPGDPEFHL